MLLGACGLKVPPTPTQTCVLGEGRLHLQIEVPRGLALATGDEVCLLADEEDETGAVMVATMTTEQEGGEVLLRDPERFFAETTIIGEAPELIGPRRVTVMEQEVELLEWRAELPDLGPSRVGTIVWRPRDQGARMVIFLLQAAGADSELPLPLIERFVDHHVEL